MLSWHKRLVNSLQFLIMKKEKLLKEKTNVIKSSRSNMKRFTEMRFHLVRFSEACEFGF